MPNHLLLKPAAKGRWYPWVQARGNSGLCFTVSYPHLEDILKEHKRLGKNEYIEKVRVDKLGITVFIGRKA